MAELPPGSQVSGPPVARSRRLKLWAIGSGAVVVLGVVAALVTGGGNGSGGSGSSDKLPPGGQMVLVNNAPPPKKGDKVLAAGETSVHGLRYRVVVSRPNTKGPKRGAVPLHFNEYMGSPPKLLQRFEVPVKFFRDSVIASFKIEADPDPNPEK